jgi:Gamma-aminobutyrate permease and related permeases
MISVTLFGELEFWAAAIKVLALMTFLVAGTIFLAGRYQIQGQSTGFSVIADNGGLFPAGLFPLVIVMSGVVLPMPQSNSSEQRPVRLPIRIRSCRVRSTR